MAYRGDVMACEVQFDEAKNGTIPIVFFKNSQVVERAYMKYTAGQTELFPFVAMGYNGIRVLAKVPQLATHLLCDLIRFNRKKACNLLWH